MSLATTSASSNRLLAALPGDVMARLLEDASNVDLSQGQEIVAPNALPSYVYFPLDCVLSVQNQAEPHHRVETASIGNEGFAPPCVLNGVPSVTEGLIVQVGGSALRVGLTTFIAVLRDFPAFRSVLTPYTQQVFSLAAQFSACARVHSVSQRCASWLMLVDDRMTGGTFGMTHLFMSQLLGVRRSSVSVTNEMLRELGAITYRRGRIGIVDRDILGRVSCTCYEIVRRIFGTADRGPGTQLSPALA